MTEEYFEGNTGTGRLLAGSPFTTSSKGFQGKTVDPHYFVQVAFPKNAPELAQLQATCNAAARAFFIQGEPDAPHFSWKRVDGDAPEQAGREGRAGCWVYTFRSGAEYPPRYIVDSNYNEIVSPEQLKPGYHVRIAYSVKANKDAAKPGVFLNLNAIMLIAQDKPIVTGPSAQQMFGAPAPQTPQGYPATPQTPARPQPQPQTHQGYPVSPQTPAPQTPQGYPAAPQTPAPQTPQGYPVQPDPTFLDPSHNIQAAAISEEDIPF